MGHDEGAVRAPETGVDHDAAPGGDLDRHATLAAKVLAQHRDLEKATGLLDSAWTLFDALRDRGEKSTSFRDFGDRLHGLTPRRETGRAKPLNWVNRRYRAAQVFTRNLANSGPLHEV